MATIFSHALVGATLVSIQPSRYRSAKIYALAAITAVLPDLDYAGFINHIPYGSLWGHRGLSHSLLFAAIVGVVIAVIFSFRSKLSFLSMAVLFFMTTASHGALDAFTNGGLGVAFYSPINQTRYFFPWRPVKVSPMGLEFFSPRGIEVLRSELYWIIIPCLVILFVRALTRNK